MVNCMLNTNKKIDIKYKQNYTIIVLLLFTLLFISESQAITNNGVIIPFIKSNASIIFLSILTFSILIILFFKRKVYFDWVTLILFFRFVLGLIPMLYIDIPQSYFGNLVTSAFPFLIYFVMSNIRVNQKVINDIFLLTGIIIAVQCLYAFYLIGAYGYANYLDLFYKKYIVIPVGASNNIAACILPLLIMGNLTIKKKSCNILYTILLCVAIIITKSRTGMILATAFFGVRLFIRRNRKIKLWHFVFVIIFFIIGTILLISSSKSILNLLIKLFSGFSSSGDGLDSLLSGRLSVFSNVFGAIKLHPIFGNGVSYEIFDNLRTHNAFLTVLYEHGIFGLMFFISFLFLSLKRVHKYKKVNDINYAFSIAIIFIFINSMVEETLFTSFIVLFCLSYYATLKTGGKNNV